jgi:hypothetical protein
MRLKHSGQPKASAERVMKNIRRATRRHLDGDLVAVFHNGMIDADLSCKYMHKNGQNVNGTVRNSCQWVHVWASR